jgi:hypothetical protein
MEDKITYGVLWKTKLDPDEWQLFAGWFEDCTDAVNEVIKTVENPRCIESRLVKRTETFKSLGAWRKSRWKLS